MHEQLIRNVSGIGNGAHVFVPKEWMNNEVFVIRKVKTRLSLKEEILDVLDNYLENTEGIYLYGSRARGEAETDSDIDLFIVTNKKIKIKIKNFEIIAIEKDKIEKAIKLEPVIMYSILSEAKPIFNSGLLDELRMKYKPRISDFKEFLDETSRIININYDILKEDKARGNFASEAVAYSLILRLRGLFIINQLMKNRTYSHVAFNHWLNMDIDEFKHKNINKIYKELKKGKKIYSKLTVKDAESLLDLLKKEVLNLRRKIHG